MTTIKTWKERMLDPKKTDWANAMEEEIAELRAALAAATAPQQPAQDKPAAIMDEAAWSFHCAALKAEYPGIAGEFKVFDISITTELDCNLSEGEYGIDICGLVNGCVGEHDFGRIEDAVSEVIETLGLPAEGQTIVRVYESGEREDVYWNSYWLVAAPAPDSAEQKL